MPWLWERGLGTGPLTKEANHVSKRHCLGPASMKRHARDPSRLDYSATNLVYNCGWREGKWLLGTQRRMPGSVLRIRPAREIRK